MADTEDNLVRLNVGGSSFVLAKHLNSREESFLSQFLCTSHAERLMIAHAYLEKSQEYYFARSPVLFEPIFRFHITGHLHRPSSNACLAEFQDELKFWGVDPKRLDKCCAKLEKKETNIIVFEPKYLTLRERLWHFSEGDGTRASTYFQFVSLIFIFVSITCLILGTMDGFRVKNAENWKNGTKLSKSLDSEPMPTLEYIEYGCIAFFTAEYFARLYLSPRRLAFLLSPLNVVDFIAIAPFYLELGLTVSGFPAGDLSAAMVLRVLRVLRVARVLRLGRHNQAMHLFMAALANAGKQLLACLGLFIIMMVFFSTVLYFMEESSVDTPITSIPVGFWWCVVTMTTVGYGDVVPVTFQGKLAASIAILCGVLVLALPITVIVSNFSNMNAPETEEKKDKPEDNLV